MQGALPCQTATFAVFSRAVSDAMVSNSQRPARLLYNSTDCSCDVLGLGTFAWGGPSDAAVSVGVFSVAVPYARVSMRVSPGDAFASDVLGCGQRYFSPCSTLAFAAASNTHAMGLSLFVEGGVQPVSAAQISTPASSVSCRSQMRGACANANFGCPAPSSALVVGAPSVWLDGLNFVGCLGTAASLPVLVINTNMANVFMTNMLIANNSFV